MSDDGLTRSQCIFFFFEIAHTRAKTQIAFQNRRPFEECVQSVDLIKQINFDKISRQFKMAILEKQTKSVFSFLFQSAKNGS